MIDVPHEVHLAAYKYALLSSTDKKDRPGSPLTDCYASVILQASSALTVLGCLEKGCGLIHSYKKKKKPEYPLVQW